MLTRRKFIQQNARVITGAWLLPGLLCNREEDTVMTVNGAIASTGLHFTLTHEHILVDFIGAEQVGKNRYNANEVFAVALPYLKQLKQKGCKSFVDCTPAYLGRDAKLLQRLATATGLHIITNTGYYGAVNEKYLPRHVYTETAEQIAERWINEWENGIEGTGIKPGFIKSGTDKAPLSPAQEKIMNAAAITHLTTGLTIGVHTGNGEAFREQSAIFKKRKIAPEAHIWIHAQNETNSEYHVEAARQGSRVSFDGVNTGSIQSNIRNLQNMKQAGLLDHVLVSQDSGWYHVGEEKGGTFNNYNCILDEFIPAMKKNDFTQEEIDKIFITNPASAFTIRVRKTEV